MTNDWFVSEEASGSNPDIYIESKSYGTICQITGGELEHRRARAALIAKAPAFKWACEMVEAWLSSEANEIEVGAGVGCAWDMLDIVREALKNS